VLVQMLSLLSQPKRARSTRAFSLEISVVG
jgi:hypothetical protein